MAVFRSNFLYLLDEDGNSNNGHVVSEIADAEANSTEATDDSVITVGELFTVVFIDPDTDNTFGGTYTYVGHTDTFGGFVGQDDNGDYYLFSNNADIPVGQNINDFEAQDIIICFLAGTMISCPEGERAVETLAIGDLVSTADGRTVPVRWLGRQTIATLFAIPEGRCPVAISAGALGDNLPARDLRLTSDHALLLDGVLVQAGALVNGTTIRRIPSAELGERFTVFHIETENHEVILAESAPAETFVDSVTRRLFDNHAEYFALYGTQTGAMAERPEPRGMSARQVPSGIRARIAERAVLRRAAFGKAA